MAPFEIDRCMLDAHASLLPVVLLPPCSQVVVLNGLSANAGLSQDQFRETSHALLQDPVMGNLNEGVRAIGLVRDVDRCVPNDVVLHSTAMHVVRDVIPQSAYRIVRATADRVLKVTVHHAVHAKRLASHVDFKVFLLVVRHVSSHNERMLFQVPQSPKLVVVADRVADQIDEHSVWRAALHILCVSNVIQLPLRILEEGLELALACFY